MTRFAEQSPNRCPCCRQTARIDGPALFGETICWHCGALLWYVVVWRRGRRETIWLFERRVNQKRIDRLHDHLEELFGPPDAMRDETCLQDLGYDSLDLVELVMELEEEQFDDDDDSSAA